jgi:hypothetical protein
VDRLAANPRDRTVTLHVPDFGNSTRNRQIDDLMQEFARRLVVILQYEK